MSRRELAQAMNSSRKCAEIFVDLALEFSARPHYTDKTIFIFRGTFKTEIKTEIRESREIRGYILIHKLKCQMTIGVHGYGEVYEACL